MPAVVRGRPSQNGKSPKGGRAAPRARPRQPQPVYGGVGQFVGLHPRFALWAALTVVMAAVIVTLATGGRGAAIAANIARGADNAMGAVGFAVRKVHVEGGSRFAEADIRKAINLESGQPILGLDLDRLREDVEKVGWVKSARVVRLMPDTLVVVVNERQRLAVWQHSGQLAVIDSDGQPINEADPGQFSDLPLVVGDGANASASAIINLLQARPTLLSKLDAVVRVDGRRWDLRLRDGSLVQLPAQGEDAALIQLDRLDRDQRVLELGFSRIDLRTGDPLVRAKGRDGSVAPAAAPASAAVTG